MSTSATITVLGGIHAGATLLLAEGDEITVGAGDEAGLVLVDAGVVAHHAELALGDGALRITAWHEGVKVFGHPLMPGKTTMLKPGATFTVGGVPIQFAGPDPVTPEEARAAERAWLIANEPLGWAAKRWGFASRGAKFTLALLLMVLAASAVWQRYGARGTGHEPQKLDGEFRYVSVRADEKTHATVYEGYVPTSPELAALAVIARRDSCAPVLRVLALDQIRDQLGDYLKKYYRGARIEAGEPGTFVVIAPDEDGYLLPDSWDYARIARGAVESVNGLRELNFEGHAPGDGPVRVPLSAIGMNLVRSDSGSWIVDANGVRYFRGAQLPFGTIVGIAGCTVKIARRGDGTPYEFHAQTEGGKQRCD